ncbi:YwmB family TATA-box binding protein [Terrisporobacter sp.]
MKAIKFIAIFLLLFVLGMFISYADVKCNNWTDNFIKAFEQTNSKFKFYDIKINSVVSNEKSQEYIKNICIDAVNCLGINKDNIKWTIRQENNNIKIYAKVKDNNYTVSFTAIKKNDEECYIIIDILSNKVYKRIVDTYQNLYELLNKHSNSLENSLCIVGEYTKNLQLYKSNDILEDILYNMNAKEIDKIKDKKFISVTAYSNLLAENDLEYLGNKINLNIGIRYSENEDKTLIYIATPIIKLDY